MGLQLTVTFLKRSTLQIIEEPLENKLRIKPSTIHACDTHNQMAVTEKSMKGQTTDYCLCTGSGASFLFAAATAAGEKIEDATTAFLFFCQFFVNALESPNRTKLAA